MANLPIGALTVDPTGQVLYAGTGEDNRCGDCQFGSGIIKSIDGGTTWTLLAGIPPSQIGSIALDRTTQGASQQVFVATPSLQSSQDGGATWSLVSLPQTGLEVDQIIQDPGNPTVFYAAGTDRCQGQIGAAIDTSTDRGKNWTTSFQTPSGTKASRIAIGVGPSGTGFAQVSDCATKGAGLLAIEKTIDRQHWNPITKPSIDYFHHGKDPGQGAYDSVVAVDPTNPMNAVFGAIDLIATVNGGNSFQEIGNVYNSGPVHPDQHAIAFFNNKSFYAGNDGGIWATRDLGGSGQQSDWSDLNDTLQITEFYRGSALSIFNLVGGAQDNGTSGHFGASPRLPAWQGYIRGDGGFSAIDPTSGSSKIYGTAGNGANTLAIWKTSSNPGSSVDIASPCSTNDTSGGEPACSNPSKKNGEPSDFTAPLVIDPTNPQRLLTATDHVYETTKGGTPAGMDKYTFCIGGCAWSYDQDPNPKTPHTKALGADISDMIIGPPGLTKTVLTGSSDGAIYMTTNDLGTAQTPWMNITGDSFMGRILGLAINPSNPTEVWATDGQIWHTTNAGAGNGPQTHWSVLSFDSTATSIALDPSNPAAVYAGTYGGVELCGSCGGANPQPSWATLGTRLPNVLVNWVTVTQDHQNLIAWTAGRGAWEVPLPAAARAILPYVSNGSGSIVTATTIQNDGTASASVSIQYFDRTGHLVGSDSNSALPVNASWTVRQDNGNSFAVGKDGSALIQSDQPVSAFVNEYLAIAGNDASSYSAVSASTGPSRTLYAPEVVNNAYGSDSSTIDVVNEGKVPTSVTLTYRDGGGNVATTYTSPSTIPPLGMSTIGPSTVSLPNGFIGTATIQSGGEPLDALVTTTGLHGQIRSYAALPTTGSTGPGSTLYIPGTMNTFDLFGNATVPLPPMTGITKIFASGGAALALRSDGTVWAWGQNYNGQLGNGGGASNIPPGPCPCYSPSSPMPVEVLGEGGVGYLTNVVAIGGGSGTSLAVTSDGSVWAWGYNFFGQLGDGTTTDRFTPVRVQKTGGGYLTGATAVVSGSSHSMALLSDGTVWAWGNGYEGELGNGLQNSSYQAQPVPGLSGVSAIAAGGGHSLAVIQADGSVRAWGQNRSGELGIGSTTNALSPQPVLAPAGQPGYLTGILAVAAGINHSIALKSDGSAVYAWGSNAYGQLGVNSTTDSAVPEVVSAPAGQSGYLTNIRTIAADAYQSAASTADLASVYAWGAGPGGQFLVPTPVTSLPQTTALGLAGYPVALKSDGTAYSYGNFGNCGTSSAGTTPVVVVGQGCYHSSRLAVQNTTSTAGTVTVSYYDSLGNTYATDTFTVAANGSLAIDSSDMNTGPPVQGAPIVPYATLLSSTVPIGAIADALPVTQGINYIGDMSATAFTSSAYNALNAGSGTVYLPLAESLGSDGIGTAVGIMNTGAASTTVTLTYYDAATGSQIGTPQSQTVPAKAIATIYQVGGGLPAGSRATAIVTTSTGGQVVVLCNELASGELMSYVGQ